MIANVDLITWVGTAVVIILGGLGIISFGSLCVYILISLWSDMSARLKKKKEQ